MKGNIYKLTCDKTDKIYIGSTITTLKRRLIKHKSEKTSVSKILFELGEVEIVLLEEYECENRIELRKREQYYMDLYEDTKINIVRAYTDKHKYNTEYNKKNRHRQKEWRENNKEKVKEYQKQYRASHQDTLPVAKV